MWNIEFLSSDFLPYLPEKSQANPGLYGFELAQWLSQALARQGIVTSYPLGEDWGWFIEMRGEAEFMIGCSSIAEEGAGYTGHPIRWGIFVKPRRSLKRWMSGDASEKEIQRIANAISAVLAEKGIRAEQVKG